MTEQTIGERIATAIEAERLVDNTGTAEDEAYNDAIDTAVRIAREVGAETDRLREFAEWVAGLEYIRGSTIYVEDGRKAHVGIFDVIARARKALGKE